MSAGYDKTMLFVYNPKAGKAKIRNKLADILEIFARAGYEVTVYPTRKKGDAVEIVANRKPIYDLVVCSGGDGTLDEVVAGMSKSSFRTPIGYIPAGSTNDFGGSLHLPKKMTEAAEQIVQGRNFPCDIGSFNKEPFVYIAAFGIFTDVSYETRQDIKNALGHMAYVLEGMKRISSVKPQHMKIYYDDQVIEDDFIFGMITNSVSVGGFKNITGKNVKLDDGVFEVTMVKYPGSPVEMTRIMNSIMSRDVDPGVIYCFKTATIRLESEDEVAWTLDGENGGLHKEVLIENIHRAVEIRVDALPAENRSGGVIEKFR